MSTPEQPSGQGLTRKQLREIRMTGATPVVMKDADAPAVDAPQAAEPATDSAATKTSEQAAPEASAPATPAPATPAVPLPRPAAPVAATPAPKPDAQVDLGVAPLTRRQAREQERIRTASVPVITPDVAAAADSPWAPPAPASASPAAPATEEKPAAEAQTEAVESEAGAEGATTAESSAPESTDLPVPAFGSAEAAVEAESSEADSVEAEPVDVEPADEPKADAETEAPSDAPAADALIAAEGPDVETSTEPEEERPVLRPEFGSTLLAGAAASDLPPSFDDLLARGGSSTGSLATPNALILSQSPTAGPLTSPVAATGEVLITGTFNLPEGLGSQGHAHGTTDGKEADSVLIDGELPAASSPTPIAASAAISQVKGTGEIIRPPAPEKGNKLMLGLAITAGVLAVALVGVLILAFVTGVF